MREIRTKIEINATPEKIWGILTKFDDYTNWNPFIISIEGNLKPRSRIKVVIQPPGDSTTVFRPRINTLKRFESFSWIGHFLIVGLFDGHHIFELESIDNQKTRLIHREEFSGLLVTLFWEKVQTKVKAGFESMNVVLKEIAERN